MRTWLTDKTRAEFAEIYDCEPHEVEARLEAHQPKRFMALCIEQSGLMASIEAVEPLTVATALGAVNLLDAMTERRRRTLADLAIVATSIAMDDAASAAVKGDAVALASEVV